MANTITNFLVGIGYDYDTRGQQEIASGIDSLQSKALQFGAVVAGAFGIRALTTDFARSRDELGKFAEVFGVSADDVNAFGAALTREGGSLDSFVSQLSNLERLRAGILAGDAGFIGAAGRAGIDTTGLVNAQDATEAYLALADEFVNLSRQERLNAAEALGLDEASIRLLSRGREGVEALVEAQRRIRPVSLAATSAAADFNDETADLSNNIGQFADRISTRLLPEVNNVIAGMNDWIGENRAFLSQGLDVALDVIGENFVIITGAATGLLASGLLGYLGSLGAAIPIVGAGLATLAAGLATVTGVAAAAATGVAIGSVISDNLSEDQSGFIGESVARTLAFFGNEEAQSALIANGVIEDPTLARATTPRFDISSLELAQPQTPDSFLTSNQAATQASAAQPVQVNLVLDGEVIDQRTVDVMNTQAQTAIDDIQSPVRG